MKKFSDKIAIMLVCMILGLMLAAQFKNVQNVGECVLQGLGTYLTNSEAESGYCKSAELDPEWKTS